MHCRIIRSEVLHRLLDVSRKALTDNAAYFHSQVEPLCKEQELRSPGLINEPQQPVAGLSQDASGPNEQNGNQAHSSSAQPAANIATMINMKAAGGLYSSKRRSANGGAGGGNAGLTSMCQIRPSSLSPIDVSRPHGAGAKDGVPGGIEADGRVSAQQHVVAPALQTVLSLAGNALQDRRFQSAVAAAAQKAAATPVSRRLSSTSSGASLFFLLKIMIQLINASAVLRLACLMQSLRLTLCCAGQGDSRFSVIPPDTPGDEVVNRKGIAAAE